MTIPTITRPQYYPALDGLRALAVLIVFWQHYLIGKPPLYNWGWLGVDVFFVISGFLITGILYDSRERSYRFRDFYARRVLRILPLYYGVLLAILLTKPILHWITPRPMLFWVLHLGNIARYVHMYAGNENQIDFLISRTGKAWNTDLRIGHFWSLCVEEQFYLVWPLVVFTTRSRRTLLWICTIFIILCPIARTVASYTLPQVYLDRQILYRFTPFRVDALLMGALLALLMRGTEREWITRHGRKLAIALILLFGVCVTLYTGIRGVGANLSDHLLPTVGFSIIDLFSIGLILELIRDTGSPVRIASWKPLRQLGTISYGVYVFHDMFHDIYIKVATRIGRHLFIHKLDNLIAFIALVSTIAIATLSYRLYELPFLSLKSRFSHQTHKAPKIHDEALAESVLPQ